MLIFERRTGPQWAGLRRAHPPFRAVATTSSMHWPRLPRMPGRRWLDHGGDWRRDRGGGSLVENIQFHDDGRLTRGSGVQLNRNGGGRVACATECGAVRDRGVDRGGRALPLRVRGARSNPAVDRARDHIHHPSIANDGDWDDEMFMVIVHLAAMLQLRVPGTQAVERAMSGGAHPHFLHPFPPPPRVSRSNTPPMCHAAAHSSRADTLPPRAHSSAGGNGQQRVSAGVRARACVRH